MTDFELRQYKCLKLEEKMLENSLFDLEIKAEPKALTYDKEKLAPTNQVSDTTCDTVTEIVDTKEELRLAQKRTWKKRLEIERFLNTIDDAEMRVAIRLYYIEQKTWLQVGMELSYDESWIRKKTLSYLSGQMSLF